ncbi:hypothetical protein GKQ23_08800 [Erwinia sp. E602]|uniref:hypothetical protein n=1 Tax=unclassified Erwinia TaxID=2622719 RepID=UPI000A65BC0A|nr:MULTISPECIES: hypothetical protein [unclassified Erwinia]QUG75082.1 hypothetical protein GKQ23_08800 [Erwinia sp. E602]
MSTGLSETDELRAVMGAAVTTIIKAGQPVTRLSLIATLTLLGGQTTDSRRQRVCIRARSLLGEYFT